MVSSIRERVRVRTCCGCLHLFTGMMVNLGIMVAIGLIASASTKRGWFLALDKNLIDGATSTQSLAELHSYYINYGWKRYCFEEDFANGSNVETCMTLDQSYTTSGGEMLKLGGTTLQSWGAAAAAATFWTTVWSAGWFVAFLLMSINLKPLLCNLAYMRIFGLGSLVAGIALAVTLGGFYGKAFTKFNDAYDNVSSSKPNGLYPVEAWWLLLLGPCLSFLGWGCTFTGSFGAAVDHAIWAKGDEQVVLQTVYVVEQPAPMRAQAHPGTMV